MIKLFNDKAILTTQNPEAFLNFNYVAGDPSYWICPSCNISAGLLYVNGIDIANYVTRYDTNYALQLNADNSVASFHIYTRQLADFNYNLKLLFYDSIDCSVFVSNVDVSNFIDVSIHNRTNFANLNVYENNSVLVDGNASYLILRSNPKFTGNIKLVIDTSNDIFLDTFKISNTLADKRYRHQQVSANSVLSNDIRNVFKDMPIGELYNIGDSAFNISVPKTKYSDQYNTTYNYGARLLEDELYPEDNALLAPIWINSDLPDYFCIFRLPGVYNTETYAGSSLSNLAFKYLDQGDIIKTWSLKADSPLGTYLNTHLTDLTNNIQAPVFLSLTDPSIATAQSDPNTWYGMAVDKGVLTGRSETPYYFNKAIDNFTQLNAFVSGGFERNNLLCPNLLNLEYIFDDNDVSAYVMNRYFGLYLTENILYNIGFWSDTIDSSANLVSFDGRDISTFINSIIFDSDGSIVSEYKNRIFVINDGIQLTRIFNSNQITSGEYVSVPAENIFSTKVIKEDYTPFITLTLNTELHQGEQLRVINKTKNKIWEIYGVDTSLSCDRYVSTSSSTGYPTIYQTPFQVGGDITDQLKAIEDAFDLFASYEDNIFRSGLRGNNWVSIIVNDDASITDEWVFQRITSQTLNVFTDPSSGFNSASNESDVTFFGRLTPTSADVQVVNFDASYGPINFELFGNRRSIFVDFFKRQNNLLYSFYDTSILQKFVTNILYQGYDDWYKLIQNFSISTDLSTYSYQYVLDPLSIETKWLIQTKENIQTINNVWNAYSLKDINISLMGINSVKDIDYTVYDNVNLNTQSEYWYKRDDDVSTYQIVIEAGDSSVFDIRNSYQILSGTGSYSHGSDPGIIYAAGDKFNTFFDNVTVITNTKTVITYNVLNGNKTYKSYTTGINEENLYDYYDSSILLKYSLTTPYVSKWIGLGTDCRNNDFRLIFDASLLDDFSTEKINYIPFSSHYTDEFTYPSFKYLSAGIRNWEDYIFYDINDTVEYNEDVSIYKIIKELMFEKPYVDIFSKLIYHNNNVNNIKNRSSIVHYNTYNESLNVLALGLNLSLQIKEGAKNVLNAKDYDKYRFCLMSTSSKNRDNRRPIEVIINENTGTILMIWYQGSDVLNYTLRNSTYVPGKSLLDPCSNYFVTDTIVNNSTQYSFIKTPFIVNTAGITKTLYDVYGINSLYDSSTVRPYAQFNYSPYGINSIWNAFTLNNDISAGKFVSGLSYNTFTQVIQYGYLPNINTFGNKITNYGYKYQTNENLYSTNTCDLDTFTHLINPAKDYVSYYILRGTSIITNDNFAFAPIRINVNSPRQFNNLYTYNGWFTPKLDNILEFKNNEETDLISIVEKDFILSNTNLKLYKDLDQVWFNDVVNTVTPANVATGNAISYFPNFNVFKAQWDKNYYYNSETASYVNGYNSSVELPSFFGSKIIKLPYYLELSSWDSNTVVIRSNATTTVLFFYLTQAINQLFKSNSTFLNNWTGLSSADDIINSYVKDTILSYYNISIEKIRVQLYHKPFDTQFLWSTFDSKFVEDLKINLSPQLYNTNNEYVYHMTIPTSNNYSYFVKFTLFEK
jgi:hypothetical protein